MYLAIWQNCFLVNFIIPDMKLLTIAQLFFTKTQPRGKLQGNLPSSKPTKSRAIKGQHQFKLLIKIKIVHKIVHLPFG